VLSARESKEWLEDEEDMRNDAHPGGVEEERRNFRFSRGSFPRTCSSLQVHPSKLSAAVAAAALKRKVDPYLVYNVR
jgi:hypothetical protein